MPGILPEWRRPTRLIKNTFLDDYFSARVLLLHFDGQNNSSVFTDSSSYANSVTIAAGTPILKTDQAKYGQSSLYLDGNSVLAWNGVTFAQDFTFEAQVYMANINASNALIGATSENGNIQLLRFNGNGTGTIMNYANGYLTTSTGSEMAGLASNTWFHVALCRTSGVIRTFINGNIVQQSNNNSSFFINRIGAGYLGAGDRFVGYLDEVRASNRGEYTANFTPPTAPFPDA